MFFRLVIVFILLLSFGCQSTKKIENQFSYKPKDILLLLANHCKKEHNKKFYDFIHIERNIEKNKVMILCFTYNDKSHCFDYDAFEYNQFNLNYSFKQIDDYTDYKNLISTYKNYMNEKYLLYFEKTVSYKGNSIDEWEAAILKTNEILSNIFEVESYSDFPVYICYIPILKVFEVRYMSYCGVICSFENKKLSEESAKLAPFEEKEFVFDFEPKIDTEHCFLVLEKDMSICPVSDFCPDLNNFKVVIDGYKEVGIVCGRQIWF